MANEEIYIIKFASWLTSVLGQGGTFVSEMDAEDFGTRLPVAIFTDPDVLSAKQAASAASQTLTEVSNDLDSATAAGDEVKMLLAIIKTGQGLIQYYKALDDLIDAVKNQIDAGSMPDANERAIAEAFASGLARRIADNVILLTIETTQPRFTFLLKLFGLIEWTKIESDPANPLSQPYVSRRLNLHRIKDLISDPVQHLIDTIGWGGNGFDPSEFFNIIESFYDDEDDIESGIIEGDPFIKFGRIRLRRDSSQSPPGARLDLDASIEEDFSVRRDMTDNWGAGIDTSLTFTGGVSATLRPPTNLSVKPEGGDLVGEFKLYVDRNASARPFDLVGGIGGLLSLSVDNISAGVGLKAEWNAATGAASIDPLLFSNMDGLTLKIGSSDADSFIANLLSSAEIKGEFDLGLEWTGQEGLRVKASGGIEIALPIHKQIGPIEFETVYLILKILNDGTLSLEVSTGLNGSMGPLSAAVERIGVLVDARFAEGTDANFGPFDLDLRFKPPNGIGLAINGGAIVGGGYVYLDPDKGEYVGALELTFSEFLSLKAIGLISTKMPDGSDGFSLLVIITAEFGAGLQLGYGFVLLSVGGLLGLNRMVKLQALMEGVRTGAINNIMFPTNVVGNAPRIISDLKVIFPPEEGIFLIGPMAKLGWGSPVLITISLGIIIEIPGNIAILGVIKVALPEEKIPVLVLQVIFAGAIEFDKHRIYFFAALFESRILAITLDGEMGLLMAWGNNANFVLTVGGFNPLYKPPPLPFSKPKRLTISILNTSAARILADGYFGITSNSAQFGARAELFFGFSALKVSGHIGFDALFQFSPFHFIILIGASVSLKIFGMGVFSIGLKFSLEGPAPWRTKGKGKISFLFVSYSVKFDITWGGPKNTLLPPINVMPLLESEFGKLENWTATVPSANKLLVSLRALKNIDDLVLHPVGTLRVSQRAVPMDLTISKVGNQKANDATKFTLEVTGGTLSEHSKATEQFAIGQYQDLDNTSKLTRAAFQTQNSGLELSAVGEQMVSSRSVKRVVRYELVIIDTNFKRFVQYFFQFTSSLFTLFLNGSAVTKSELSNKFKKQMQPFGDKIIVKDEGFVVVMKDNNSAAGDEGKIFAGEASASEYLNELQMADPKLSGQMQVIPEMEVNTAA